MAPVQRVWVAASASTPVSVRITLPSSKQLLDQELGG